MRVLVARCTVDYNGRLTAHLPEAVRLIMVKADGCVAVHADGGAYKPLNWMNAPNTLVVEEKETVEGSEVTDDSDNPGQKALGDVEAIWKVRNPKDEVLTITIHEVLAGRRPRTSEGRGRGPPPGTVGHRTHVNRRRTPTGSPGIPDRHRPGRPAMPQRRRTGGGSRGQTTR